MNKIKIKKFENNIKKIFSVPTPRAGDTWEAHTK
jgi:hypothetical protein